MILLGPAGAGRTALAETLLDTSGSTERRGALMESTRGRKVTNGIRITVVDTPDLLGTSLVRSKRAREALRSIQLSRPGPHAFLLVIPAPGSGIDQDVSQEIQTTIQLFGDSAAGHLIPVFTHADRLPRRRRTVEKLLEANAAFEAALSPCEQRPELVDNRPDGPSDVRSGTRRQLLERVAEMSVLRGHFVHSLQRKEEHMREALLADMASTLAEKLGNA